MNEEKLKEAFEKVKRDIDSLTEQIITLKKELQEIKTNFIQQISIGNKGVPTDRQTDRPTTNIFSTIIDDKFSLQNKIPTYIPTQNPTDIQQIDKEIQQTNTYFNTSKQQTESITELVNNLKNDLKMRFRSLTKQEFYIFQILFTVDKSQKSITYKTLSEKTGLSESSIRDYVQKIIKKGIPIVKERLNNKVTILKIPDEIRNLATLDILLRIRNQMPNSSLNEFNSKKN
ncbi:MAG: HTH domain-containing protein [Candidatus Pacearchaeota archaeon]